MYKTIKRIAAGAGVGAVLAAGLSLATPTSDDSARTYIGVGAADTITMDVDTTTLETASFAPPATAQVPCGFAATGTC